MICPNCKFLNLETARVCASCGTVLIAHNPAPAPKRHFHFLWIIIGLIVPIVLIGSLLLTKWANKINVSSQSTIGKISPVQNVSSSSGDLNSPDGWNEFTNSRYNFSFKYPKDFSIQESSYGDIYSVDMRGPNFGSLLEPKLIDTWPYYMYFPFQETLVINSIPWDVMAKENSCDIGSCVKNHIAYTTLHENTRFTFILTDKKSEEALRKILSTFTFSNNTKGNFFYTDELINPQTKDQYFIKKTGLSVCDVNGAQVCDLVVRTKDGNERVLANLFFAPRSQDLNAKHGASLVAFSSSDILLISFSGGEGPLYYTVEEYDLKSGKLGKTILTFKANVGQNGVIKSLTDLLDINYYEIITNEGTLYFVNKDNTKFGPQGVYFEKEGTLSKVDFSLNPPYDIVPNIKELYNYKVFKRLYLRINGKLYTFDFKTRRIDVQ